jgi:phospholipid/cholesterol/gamma-HCH transport system ATP-binding protein
MIRDLSRRLKVTSIVVSHDMHCALAIADRIAVLDEGKVIALGSPQTILQHRHPLVVDFLREAKEKLKEEEVH